MLINHFSLYKNKKINTYFLKYLINNSFEIEISKQFNLTLFYYKSQK